VSQVCQETFLKTKYGDLNRCVSANRHTIQVQVDRETEFNTESPPDRIININPGDYDPVAVEHSVAEPNEDKGSGARRHFPVYTYGSTN